MKPRPGASRTRIVEAYLLANPGETPAAIAKAINETKRAVLKSIENLRHLGLVISEAKDGPRPCRQWHRDHAVLARSALTIPSGYPPHRIEQIETGRKGKPRARVERPKPKPVIPNRSPVAPSRTAKSTEERIEYREIDGRRVKVTIGRTHDTTGDVGAQEVTRGCGPGRYLHSDSVIARAYP